MAQTIDVEINETGQIHPLNSSQNLPQGRAVLYCPDFDDLYPALMSENALEDWLRPEEDEAWADFQRAK